jgi:multicomponent Na+:H+ antiporter subunit B
MSTSLLLVLLYVFILLTAGVAVFLEDLLSSFISLSVTGVLMATAFALLRAPDVALTQAIINSGLVTSLLLVAYSQTRKNPHPPDICRECPPWLRWRFPALVCGLLAVLLFQGFFSLADVLYPGQASSHFLSRTLAETGGMNVVGAILLDYRAFDTLGETTVIFAAVSGVSLLLAGGRRIHSGHGLSYIVKRGMALLTPFILLYGASILFLGHLTPGGGFQGGSVFATVAILMCVVYGTGFEASRISVKSKETLEAGGALLFVFIGLLGAAWGGGFLANLSGPFSPGIPGSLLSGGSMPVLNLAVGLKVGAGLSSIFYAMIKILELEDEP